MPTGVALQIQKQIDAVAALRAAYVAAAVGRTKLWDIIHAADDEPYENIVEGASITAIDATLLAGAPIPTLGSWFGSHTNYFLTVLALSPATFDTFLTAQRWRVSQFFAQLHFEALGSTLTPANVFPRADLALGAHARTGDVFTPGAAVDTTASGPGKVAAVVPVGTTIGGATYTVTATLTNPDATTTALAASFSASAVAGTTIVYGQQVLTGNAASGQKVVAVGATAPFSVGNPVLVEDTAGNAEVGTVASIALNASITLGANLLNGYLTANTAKVTPLFLGVAAATDTTTGTNGDNVAFKISPDRVISTTGPA